MQSPSPEMLPEVSLDSRQLEIFKLYLQRMGSTLEQLKSDHRRYHGLDSSRPWVEIEEVEKEVLSLTHSLAASNNKKVKMSKMLGFWFVDMLQSDIAPMHSVAEAIFTHVARQDIRPSKIDATFYELLYLFYQLGSPFIRAKGVDAFSKYYELFRQAE